MNLLNDVTADTEGGMVTVPHAGDYAVLGGADDTLGGGQVQVRLYLDGRHIAAPDELTITDLSSAPVVSLARGMGVRAFLVGSTSPRLTLSLVRVSANGYR